MTKRLTVIYEVPDDYNVTRITGTGELDVVWCEWMDAMQKLRDLTARLAAAEAAIERLRANQITNAMIVAISELHAEMARSAAKGGE